MLIILLVLNPMSLTTRAILNMKPKQDNFMHPLFDLKILLELVSLRFNRLQVKKYFIISKYFKINS